MRNDIPVPTPRALLGVALAAWLLTACAPPQDLADNAPIMAEPTLAAPPDVTERKALPSPCDQDDDGIGGTGCPVE